MPRILLVEDDFEVRLLVEHVLLAAEYEVDCADTFGRGAALLDRRPYDLVVADGRLADGTGMMLADIAREKDIPALIVTGYAFVLHEEGVDLAQYDVLLKPIRPDELLAIVTEALEGRQ